MGGVQVDECARTSIAGLWCCGEAATTGIHGANRLASNSLLEALVFARRAANDIRADRTRCTVARPVPKVPELPRRGAAGRIDELVAEARQLMSSQVGIVREGKGLSAALGRLAEIDHALGDLAVAKYDTVAVRHCGEARNVLLLARLVTSAALRRTESRGAHFRRDYPMARSAWRRPQAVTAKALVAGL
jgi:L-aspartate oxidase